MCCCFLRAYRRRGRGIRRGRGVIVGAGAGGAALRAVGGGKVIGRNSRTIDGGGGAGVLMVLVGGRIVGDGAPI